VNVFNILGQSINSWKIENQEQTNINLPITNMTAGIYIVKVKTSQGEINKKIVFN
jgi:LEA14-like dessication related protein